MPEAYLRSNRADFRRVAAEGSAVRRRAGPKLGSEAVGVDAFRHPPRVEALGLFWGAGRRSATVAPHDAEPPVSTASAIVSTT